MLMFSIEESERLIIFIHSQKNYRTISRAHREKVQFAKIIICQIVLIVELSLEAK